MVFTRSTYANLVTEESAAQQRLFLQYLGPRNDFDIVIVGSGMGGGILADDLAERVGGSKRILLLEAGSFIYPTHVYNMSRFSNASIAQHYECRTFTQSGNEGSEFFLGLEPQLNFGGRSIFWSGLIPAIQPWELQFFPDAVRNDLVSGLLNRAGDTMNESHSMGSTAAAVVSALRQSPLAADFSIQETPRALHQPYLFADGTPQPEFFTEPTGVFNTAELIVNQVGLAPGTRHGDGPGLHLMLNHFVEDVQDDGSRYQLVVRDVLTGQTRTFNAGTVVLAGGSIESPKLMRRSSMFPALPPIGAEPDRARTDRPSDVERDHHVRHRHRCRPDSQERAREDHLLFPRAARSGQSRPDPVSVQHRDEYQSRVLASAGERPQRSRSAQPERFLDQSAGWAVAHRYQVQLRQLPGRRQPDRRGAALWICAEHPIPQSELDGSAPGLALPRARRLAEELPSRSSP